MDALAALLDGPRARSAFLLRALLDPPWSIRVEDRAPLSVVAVAAGSAVVVAEGGEPVDLATGDVALCRGPEAFTFADTAATPVQVVVLPEKGCTDLAGREAGEARNLGVRSWGDHLDAPTRLLVGTYERVGEVGQRLVGSLPTLAVVPAERIEPPLVGLLASELSRDEPGHDVVLDRLLDLLTVVVLRAWFTSAGADAPGWYRAGSDPVVGPALQHLHDDPAHPWTVAALAGAVGTSRATLARRFTELVGEAPMSYLTSWRLSLAADLLAEPGTTLGSVARRVGYSSPFALSAAFKRERGVSPKEHRELVAG